MTKKTIKTIVLIVAFIALFIALVVRANNIPSKEVNKPETIWSLVDKMDSLRDLKEECANGLWIKDSAHFLRGDSWYCDSWDNEIIELRNQISELWKKDYEGLR